ncbi:MAG TPA: hypothetical protein ENI86_06065 [Acidimicrobiales bacterium]|nr:hypothetical protein [Acidimicrobiales bacterium]
MVEADRQGPQEGVTRMVDPRTGLDPTPGPARTVTPDPADPLDRKVQPLAAAAVVALALVVVWWWRRSRGR